MIATRELRLLALLAAGTALGGCVMGQKETGIFTPATLDTPPSVRGTSGEAPAEKSKSAPDQRRTRLNVPARAQ